MTPCCAIKMATDTPLLLGKYMSNLTTIKYYKSKYYNIKAITNINNVTILTVWCHQSKQDVQSAKYLHINILSSCTLHLTNNIKRLNQRVSSSMVNAHLPLVSGPWKDIHFMKTVVLNNVARFYFSN